MAKLKMNFDKPYQEVHGEDTGGARYSQDGFHYDRHGDLIEALVGENQAARLKRLKRESAAAAAAKAAYEAALSAGDDDADEDEPKASGGAAGGVDLAAYLRGTLAPKPTWPAVQAATKALTGVEPQSKAQLIELLVDEAGIVPAEEVKLKA